MSGSSSSSGCFGFFGVLGIMFIVLKLAGLIDWSWVCVLMPIWGPPAVIFAIIALALLFMAVAFMVDSAFGR